MRIKNNYRSQQRDNSAISQTFILVLGACLTVMACSTGTSPNGDNGGGGGGGGSGPNTEQQGTWKDRGVIADAGYGFRFAVSEDGKKVAGGIANGHLYTSSDLDKPWTDRSNGEADGQIYWYAFASSADGGNLAAVTQHYTLDKLIFTSINSGETWNDRTPTSGDGSGKLKWQDIASSSDGTKLVAVVGPGHIYRSIDSGKTWKDISPSNGIASGDLYWLRVASSSDGQKLVAITGGMYSGGSHVFTSDDAGGHWKEQNFIQTDGKTTAIFLHSVSCSSDCNYIVLSGQYSTNASGNVTSVVKVFTSDNFGTTWTDRNLQKASDETFIKNLSGGLDIVTFSASSADGSRIAILVYGEGLPTNLLLTSSSHGKLWYEQTLFSSPQDTKKAALYGITSSSDGRLLNIARGEKTSTEGSGFDRWRMLVLTFP